MSGLLGLSQADANLYTAALAEDCEVAYQVLNLDLSHRLIASIQPILLDGQLDYSAGDTDTVTQMCTLNFLDPDRTLLFDNTTPGAGVGGLNRLIQVRSYVRSDITQGRWIGAYAFTGRPSGDVGRDGDMINLVAESKECIHLRGIGHNYVEKGSWRVAAIRSILQGGGETRFRFPATSAGGKLAARVYYGGMDEADQPWKVAWKLARGMGHQLYYDKTGFACLRPIPQAPMFTIREQYPNANALGRIKTTTDLRKTSKNRVIVHAETKPPKSAKGKAADPKPIIATWVAPSWHPSSAQSRAQNGILYYDTAEYDQSDIHTQADANAFAAARGKELLEQESQVEATIMPIWHADPMDLFRIQALNGADFMIRLLNGSSPIGPSDSGMTVGYNQRVARPALRRLR